MAARNADIRAALTYHEATKHSQRSLEANPHFLDWETKPLPFKIYRDLEPIPLVPDAPPSDVPALDSSLRTISLISRRVCGSPTGSHGTVGQVNRCWRAFRRHMKSQTAKT